MAGELEGDTAGRVEVGRPAPDFSLPDQDGAAVSLTSFHGQVLVLYFYPKDDTSGCTAQAVDFTAHAQAFREAGATILGVSPDTPRSHASFRTKHALGIPLASDESKTTLAAYGVWVEKSMYGRKYMGVERTTMVIAPDGTVAKIWPKVKVKDHAEEVLAFVRTMHNQAQ